MSIRQLNTIYGVQLKTEIKHSTLHLNPLPKKVDMYIYSSPAMEAVDSAGSLE